MGPNWDLTAKQVSKFIYLAIERQAIGKIRVLIKYLKNILHNNYK